MKPEILTDKYTSRDLALVSYLVASNFPLMSYEVGKEGLMLFTFSNSPELQQHISNFFRMASMVNPVAYYNSLRTIKSMLKSDRHNYNSQNDSQYVEQRYNAK